MNCSWCSRKIDPSKMNMHVDFHHPDQDITPMNLCRECTEFAVTGMKDAKILAGMICRTAKTLLEMSDRIHEQEKN